MEQVIKLVCTYRVTAGLAERIRLSEEIFCLIEPDLRVLVFSSVSHDAAKDALQEVLKGSYNCDNNKRISYLRSRLQSKILLRAGDGVGAWTGRAEEVGIWPADCLRGIPRCLQRFVN
jgi:hypothetical protein